MQALVVDDSAAVRGLLSEHLTQLGFQVEQASTGFEALAKIQTMSHLTVVLLDWTMPGMVQSSSTTVRCDMVWIFASASNPVLACSTWNPSWVKCSDRSPRTAAESSTTSACMEASR